MLYVLGYGGVGILGYRGVGHFLLSWVKFPLLGNGGMGFWGIEGVGYFGMTGGPNRCCQGPPVASFEKFGQLFLYVAPSSSPPTPYIPIWELIIDISFSPCVTY